MNFFFVYFIINIIYKMNKISKELLDYFNGDELASDTWLKKYKLGVEGNPNEERTPDDMHQRLSKEFAKVEYNFKKDDKNINKLSEYGKKLEVEYSDLSLSGLEKRYYNLFKNFKYVIPQGSIMAQAGNPSIGSLSNCLILGEPSDSYGGICLKDQELVQAIKRRCGVGLDISKLRPSEAPTSNAAKTSTGAVTFMNRYSNTTREAAQNGRRGALMISMDVNHPDILDFIKSKRDITKITGANISIKLNDEFMKAVESDSDYILRFPCDSSVGHIDEYEDEPYNTLEVEVKGQYFRKIKAKQYWDEIIKSAHNSAEPGLLFWNNMVNYSPDGLYPLYKQVATNPCSEIGTQAYDTCRLIALNLFSFVIDPFLPTARFDYEKFYQINYESARLGDNLVEMEINYLQRIIDKVEGDPEPLEERIIELNLWKKIQDTAIKSRRTGLGFTALGDAIAALGLKYDSPESLVVIENIMSVKMESELDSTIDLAITRGTFYGWDKEVEYNISFFGDKGKNPFYEFIRTKFKSQYKRMIKYGRRNVSWSTVAPTGTVSLMARTTSGVEPLFAPYYRRRKKVNVMDKTARVDFIDETGEKWQEFNVVHPKFELWFEEYSKLNPDKIKCSDTLEFCSKSELDSLYEVSPWYGAIAPEINWEKRVEIQSIIQKYVSHSISSTINLPTDVSEEEVSKIYLNSWKSGLKGITVYRDGSRDGVLLTDDSNKSTKFNETHAPKRPKSVKSKVIRFNNNKEKWIAFVGLIDNKPYEIFTGKLDDLSLPTSIEDGEIVKNRFDDGSKSYSFKYKDGEVENISKMFNTDFWNYGKLISGVLRHGMPIHHVIEMISTLSFKEDHINTWKVGVTRALKKFIPDGKPVGVKCKEPECGSTNVLFEEGCMKCLDCGSSKCG